MNRIAHTLLLPLFALALLAAPGCSDSTVGNDLLPASENPGQNAFDVYCTNPDTPSDSREWLFTFGNPTTTQGTVSDTGISVTISASAAPSAPYQHLLLSMQLPKSYTQPGSFDSLRADKHSVSVTMIGAGRTETYTLVNGTVSITDWGEESGVIKGSIDAQVRERGTGKDARVNGSFAVPQQK